MAKIPRNSGNIWGKNMANDRSYWQITRSRSQQSPTTKSERRSYGRRSGFVVICRLKMLFCDEEVVVFLAFLDDDIFIVEEHVNCCRGVSVGDFLFIDCKTTLLSHLAHFAF